MISNDIKKSMKKAARKDTFRTFMWIAFAVSLFGGMGSVDPTAGENVAVIDCLEDWKSIGIAFSVWLCLTGFVAWVMSFGNTSKKLYLKRMQKHIMEVLANTNDPVEIQRLGVAMSYYGNSMNEVQMAEVKAAAGTHTHSHSYEYRNY